MSDFQLTNEGAPPFQKDDPEAFKPMSKSQKTRQAIYAIIKNEPGSIIPVRELARRIKEDYCDVFRSAKVLVQKGLATREKIMEKKPTKNNPEREVPITCLKHIPEWGAKRQPKW